MPNVSKPLSYDQAKYGSAPVGVKAYLDHALSGCAMLPTAVKLQMTGEIKLKKWMPFTATQVVRIDQGFIWQARVKSGFMFIKGFDKYLDGVGEMQWKLLGLFPVMTGSGPDISRSAADRFAIERVLLPSAFAASDAKWTSSEQTVSVASHGLSQISLEQSPSGRVKSVSMQRWGNPDGGEFGLVPFGGYVDEEATWGGCTIPSQLRIGWHFGTDRFSDGEFFRAKITHAEFRP